MKQFELRDQKCRFANLNVRPEKHGTEPRSAADLKLVAKLPNDVLDMFDANLKGVLYHYDSKREAEGKTDLVDAGRKGDPTYLPHLRFPRLGVPLKWDSEVVGAKVTIQFGATEASNVVLEGTIVNDFSIEPQDGGTVGLTLRVQCHPKEDQFGRLSMMIGNDIVVSVEPPVVAEQAL